MLLLHVHSPDRPALSPFDYHLVRNLSWERFDPDDVDADVDMLILSTDDLIAAEQVLDKVRRRRSLLHVVVRQDSLGESRSSMGDDGVTWWIGEGPGPLSDLLRHSRGARPGAGHDADGASHDETHPDVIDLRRGVPRGGGRSMLQARLGEGAGVLGASARAFLLDRVPTAAPVEPALPAQAAETTPPPPGPAAPIIAALSPTGLPPVVPAVAPPPATPPAPRRRRDTPAESTATSPEGHVRGLLASLGGMYGLRETADAVAQHLRETVEANAVAVLVPDGPVWAVAGAIGHRHLEERLTLAADHWLVQEVCSAHHGVVIDDTDIARTRLAGAPLTAWPRLMAVPLPEVRGVAILARSSSAPGFTSRTLNQAARALTEAEGLFAAAVQLRELARLLQPFAELQDPRG